MVGDTFDYGKVRQLTAGDGLDFMRNDYQAHTSSLLYIFVFVKVCLPRLKYLQGSTQRIVVQTVDIHSFPKISEAHEYAQLAIPKADRMGNVVAFPGLHLFEFRKEPAQVFRRPEAKLPGLLLRSRWRHFSTSTKVQIMPCSMWPGGYLGQCFVKIIFRANAGFFTFKTPTVVTAKVMCSRVIGSTPFETQGGLS